MNKIITIFFFVMFVIGTDTFLISPLLPTLSNLYNVSIDISGWMVSAYALGYAIFAFVAGPISDNLNRKKVMLCGLIAFTISTFLCGIASSFWMMCGIRLIAGISAAFVTPQVWASIPLLVKPEKIIKSMGIATAGLAMSQAFGLPIGSYLASFSWSTPFFVLSGCSFVLILLILILMPSIENRQNIQNERSVVQRYKLLFSNPKASKLFLAYLLFQTGNFASFNFLGTWLNDDYNFNVTQTGIAMLILGIGNFCGSFFGSGYVSKLGNAFTLFGGVILMAVLYFSLPFYHNIVFVEITFFLTFFIAGVLFPLMMSLLQSLSTNARGTIAALSNSAMYIGATLSACIAGFLYHHFGDFTSVTTFTAIMFIFSLLVYKTSGILTPTKVSATVSQKVVK